MICAASWRKPEAQHWTGVVIELAIVGSACFIGLQVALERARAERAAEVAYSAHCRRTLDYSIESLQRLIRGMEEQHWRGKDFTTMRPTRS